MAVAIEGLNCTMVKKNWIYKQPIDKHDQHQQG